MTLHGTCFDLLSISRYLLYFISSLSTNMISNINNLQAFKKLKILSLGRNVIKNLQGIEGVSETLEQLVRLAIILSNMDFTIFFFLLFYSGCRTTILID